MNRAIAVLVVVFSSFGVAVYAEDAPPTLVATGSAVAEVDPDQLEVSFAVVSEAKKTADALEDNSKRMNRVMEALRRAGVDDDDLETVGFSVSPIYDYSKTQERQRRLVGYSVRNTVLARTLDLALAGKLIEAGVGAGADSVSGVSFGLADPQAHRAEAIAMATANARADAEALAAAAGLDLVRVLEITLDPGNDYRPRFAARAEMAMGDAAPPIQPGEVSLSARVRVVYEVRQGVVSDEEARQRHRSRSSLPFDYWYARDVHSPYEDRAGGRRGSSLEEAHHLAQEFVHALLAFDYPLAQLLTKPGTEGHRQLGEIAARIQEAASTDVMESIRLAREARQAFHVSSTQSVGFGMAEIQVLSFTDASARLRAHTPQGGSVDFGAELTELPEEHYLRLREHKNGRFVPRSGAPEQRLAWVIVPPEEGFLRVP